MSKILVDRAVVEQALEALEHHVEQTRPIYKTTMAIEALIAALEQPQVEQEPVAVVTGFYGGFPTIRPLEPATVLPAGMALYANPQQPRQPLTDDEIEKLFPYTHEWLYEIGLEEATKFARSIEAAHGIRGEA